MLHATGPSQSDEVMYQFKAASTRTQGYVSLNTINEIQLIKISVYEHWTASVV
jgi:hypothetical protein